MSRLHCPHCRMRFELDEEHETVALTMDPDREDVMLSKYTCYPCKGVFYTEQ